MARRRALPAKIILPVPPDMGGEDSEAGLYGEDTGASESFVEAGTEGMPGEAGAAAGLSAGAEAGAAAEEGTAKAKAFKPPPPEEAKQKPDWIEIRLVDRGGSPVPGERFIITLADGSIAQGTLNGEGLARIEGIPPGACMVSFPMRDRDAWKR